MPPPAQGEAGFWQVKIRLENVPMDVGLIGLQFSGINYDGVECGVSAISGCAEQCRKQKYRWTETRQEGGENECFVLHVY